MSLVQVFGGGRRHRKVPEAVIACKVRARMHQCMCATHLLLHGPYRPTHVARVYNRHTRSLSPPAYGAYGPPFSVPGEKKRGAAARAENPHHPSLSLFSLSTSLLYSLFFSLVDSMWPAFRSLSCTGALLPSCSNPAIQLGAARQEMLTHLSMSALILDADAM